MNEKRVGQAAEATRIPLRFQTSPLLRILLVEDDTGIRQLSTKMLLRSGYHVDAVEDGAVAWDTLQESSYDLLLTDNRMPKVTGVELLKKLHGARMILPVTGLIALLVAVIGAIIISWWDSFPSQSSIILYTTSDYTERTRPIDRQNG